MCKRQLMGIMYVSGARLPSWIVETGRPPPLSTVRCVPLGAVSLASSRFATFPAPSALADQNSSNNPKWPARLGCIVCSA